jgi:sugar/nucleoside kinase (ribokinase family)
MIVVVGGLAWLESSPPRPAGRACQIAMLAARAGRDVQVVGRVGDDAAGNSLVLELARARVGHVAVLRDPANPTTQLAQPLPDDDPPSMLVSQEPDPAFAPPGRPALRLDAADVELGLRYLNSFAVLVLTDDVSRSLIPVVADAASFAAAHLVLLLPDREPADLLPSDATVFGVPAGDDEGEFAALVSRYAVALDSGASPADAFVTATGHAAIGA